MTLITTPNLEDADGIYEALMDAHRALDPAAARRFDARLVLLLANHIGSATVVRAAIAAAREASPSAAGPPPTDPR